MIIKSMHRGLDITVDKLSSEAYPEILPKEKDFVLNEAMLRFIKMRYGGNNTYRTGFEQSQKRTDDLKNLVKSKYVKLEKVPYYNFNVSRGDLTELYDDVNLETQTTDEYMFYIKSLAQTCNNNCCNYYSTKQIQQDDLSKIISDPFNKPKDKHPIVFFEDGDIFVSGGNSDVESMLVTFIKYPKLMSLGYGSDPVDCELSEHTHNEIVQMAAKILIENIESPRLNTQQININESE